MATSLSFESVSRNALNFFSATPTAPSASRGPDRHGRELFLNHVWESLNAAAKILFFAVVTPIMLAAWGKEQFGLFAVANSCVALMGFLDLGLRMSTRVGLTSPRLNEASRLRLHAHNFAAFVIAAFVGVGVVCLLSVTGCWHRWLNLSTSGDVVIAVTAALTAVTMGLPLLAERIAAAGHLSRIKAVLFIANLLAFVVVIALLNNGASVTTVSTAYFAALALPLFFLLPRANLHYASFVAALRQLQPRHIFFALRGGGWINLLTAAWFFQSYGLVFLISWLIGPAAAGTFFLFLKMAELLGVLGASASEPTIAALASVPTSLDRHRHFTASYKSALALCLTGAAAYTFFCDDLFRLWLHRSLDHSYSGLLIGLFGVANGFSRMVTAASVGIGKSRDGSLGLLAGAIFLGVVIASFHGRGGLETILAIGCVSALFLLPTAIVIAREIGADFASVWMKPVVAFAPQLALIVVICWTAAWTNSLIFAAIAALISAVICARYIFRPASTSTKDSLLGYDTRSWRSAFVMKVVDLLHPFRRCEKFSWSGPCVISSVAGLGDLFIHLPLIAGLVNEARRRGIETGVALRPAHVAIGQACGWDVLPFDNSLEDFFKNPCALKPLALARQFRDARKTKANLWVDLTGSAVGALAIKLAGARKVAARITRGGRSLISHHLPHGLHENEYENLDRIAATLGCELDYTIFDRLRGEPLAGLEDTVVLCLTTICPWRNWPLTNFLEVIDRFPELQFVATGIQAEVRPEERETLEKILRRPNVVSLMDKMSILQLVRLIAHAGAVVTNDTSTAHIANAFRKPGAVMFGPASPDKLAAPYGLKSFVDRTCPFHPCVQWTCRNQENWCMRKVSAANVATHLADVLTASESYAATARAG